MKDIEKLIGQSIPVNPDHPYHSREVEMAFTLSKGKAKAQIEARENQDRGPRRPRQGSGRAHSGNGGGGQGDAQKKSRRPFWKRGRSNTASKGPSQGR